MRGIELTAPGRRVHARNRIESTATYGLLNAARHGCHRYILENEFDWPMLSSMTGFYNNTDLFPDIHGPVSSVYMKLKARNLCAHRGPHNSSNRSNNSNIIQAQLIFAISYRSNQSNRSSINQLQLTFTISSPHLHAPRARMGAWRTARAGAGAGVRTTSQCLPLICC